MPKKVNSRMFATRKKRNTSILVAVGAAVMLGGGASAVASVAPSGTLPFASPSPGGPSVKPRPVVPSDTSPPQAEPALGALPKITSGQRLAMPLDSFMTSMGDIKAIDSARLIQARNCMWSLGFRDWRADTVVTSKPSDYNESDLLDYLDPSAVSRSGYPQKLVDKGASPRPGAASKAAAPALDAMQAFIGDKPRTSTGKAVPRGGCLEQGDREVRTGSANLPTDPRALAAVARFQALRDSRTQHAFRAWNACMSQNGLNYKEPLNAQADPRWSRRAASAPASAEEKHVATIDAACQQKLNLVGTYMALEIAYQQRLLDANMSSLRASLAIFQTWVGNARTINAKG
jgi:hypothetical protein